MEIKHLEKCKEKNTAVICEKKRRVEELMTVKHGAVAASPARPSGEASLWVWPKGKKPDQN